jgi:hypothetical protein
VVRRSASAFPHAAAVIGRSGDIAEGDAFIITPITAAARTRRYRRYRQRFIGGDTVGCGSILPRRHRRPGAGQPGQARGFSRRPAFRRALPGHREKASRLIAPTAAPELVLGSIRGQVGADRLGGRSPRSWAGRHENPRLRRLFRRQAKVRRRAADATAASGGAVDDDSIDLEQPVRIHVW